MDAEEKLKQIETQVKEVEGEPLTPLDELNIIENKGIEYVLHAPNKPDLSVYVAPLKISGYRPLLEMVKPVADEPLYERMERYSKGLSQMLNVPYETLLEYLDADDIKILRGLLTSTLYEGKRIFMKKKMLLSQSEVVQAMLGKIPKTDVGSQTTSSSVSEKE